jgi:hypothetical protein
MIRRKMIKGTCIAAREEKLGFLKSLVLKILEEWLWHSVSNMKQPQAINQ